MYFFKNILFEMKLLGNGNAEFFICTKRDLIGKDSFESFRELLQSNNLIVREMGNQFLIAKATDQF